MNQNLGNPYRFFHRIVRLEWEVLKIVSQDSLWPTNRSDGYRINVNSRGGNPWLTIGEVGNAGWRWTHRGNWPWYDVEILIWFRGLGIQPHSGLYLFAAFYPELRTGLFVFNPSSGVWDLRSNS